jgi:hypothetical protein
VIPQVEWQLVRIEQSGGRASDLAFGNVGRPGDRGTATLLIRYTGRPPFSLDLLNLQGQADRGLATISENDVALVTGNVTPQPGEADVYRVPVDLVMSRSLPHRSALAAWLSGTDYSGKFRLDIAGLPDGGPLEVGFRLHNPGWTQRYIAPAYALIWPGVVTYPVSIILPLVLFAFVWLRRKDAAVERYLLRGQDVPSPVDAAGDGSAPGQASVPGAAPRPPAPAGPASAQAEPRAGTSPQVPRRPVRPAEGSASRTATRPALTGAPGKPPAGAQSAARPASPPPANPPPARPRRPSGAGGAK